MKATEVTAGLTESNGSLLLGIWRDSFHVTCGLTACTPGSAPGPTLGNECGKTLPFYRVRNCRTLDGTRTAAADAVVCFLVISMQTLHFRVVRPSVRAYVRSSGWRHSAASLPSTSAFLSARLLLLYGLDAFQLVLACLDLGITLLYHVLG